MKIARHLILSLILFFIAVILLFLSTSPLVNDKIINILQGLSTGILSGMILILITGIKNKEQRQLQITYEAIHQSISAFLNIIPFSYSMGNIIFNSNSLEDFCSNLNDIYIICQSEINTLSKINLQVMPKDICTNLHTYIYESQSTLKLLENTLPIAIESKDDKLIYNAYLDLYNVTKKAFDFYLILAKAEYVTYKKKMMIDNSLI